MQCRSHREEREADAKIAEHVMGLRVVWSDNVPHGLADEGEQPSPDNELPQYSTSLGAAMTVALQLRRLGYEVTINMDKSGTSIGIYTPDGDELIHFENIITKLANYIALAALVAVGAERRKGDDRRKQDALAG